MLSHQLESFVAGPVEELLQTIKEIEKMDFSVLYGHPVFEGFKEDILKKIFRFVLDKGYEILRHDQIYERYKHKSSEIDILDQMNCI